MPYSHLPPRKSKNRTFPELCLRPAPTAPKPPRWLGVEVRGCQPTWVSWPLQCSLRPRDFLGHPATEKAHRFVHEGMLRLLERRQLRARILNKNTSPQLEVRSKRKETRTFPWNRMQLQPGWWRCECVVGFVGVENDPGTDSELATLAGCSREFYGPQQRDPTRGDDSQAQRECKAF